MKKLNVTYIMNIKSVTIACLSVIFLYTNINAEPDQIPNKTGS